MNYVAFVTVSWHLDSMRQPRLKLSANDNTPLRQSRSYPALKPVNFLKPVPLATGSTSVNVVAEHNQKLSLAWGITALGGILVALAVWQNSDIDMLVWPAVVMGLLLIWASTRAERHTRLRNISSLMLVGAATVIAVGTLSKNGFSLIGVEIALVVSIFSLVMGWALKSRPAVMLSTLSAIGYLASLFPELGLLTGITDKISQIGIGLIPCLLIGQIFLAQKLRSHLISALTIMAAGIWVMAIASDLPLHALAGLGFALAAAHYCVARAWEATNVFGARVHSVFALTVALASALYIQSLWMQFGSETAQPIWTANNFWWSVLAISMIAIVISSLVRYKASQISLTGIFIISLGALLLPLATAKPDLMETAFYQIPGLDAYPGFGLVIGAAIIASCLIWIARGLKSGQLLTVLIGTIAIGVETFLLYQPDHFNTDFGVIFIMSLICALCVGGLIAGSTSHPTDSRPNYA